MKNVRCDLVIFYRETDKYDRKLEKNFVNLFQNAQLKVISKDAAGVFIL